jgi:hypothetical protein
MQPDAQYNAQPAQQPYNPQAQQPYNPQAQQPYNLQPQQSYNPYGGVPQRVPATGVYPPQGLPNQGAYTPRGIPNQDTYPPQGMPDQGGYAPPGASGYARPQVNDPLATVFIHHADNSRHPAHTPTMRTIKELNSEARLRYGDFVVSFRDWYSNDFIASLESWTVDGGCRHGA